MRCNALTTCERISQLDVENALRFDNKLMVFDTTPQEAKVNGLPSLQSKKGRHTARELTRTLDEAYRELAKRHGPHVCHACMKLGKFIWEVRRETGTRDGKVTSAEAATLIADANRIRAVLGC